MMTRGIWSARTAWTSSRISRVLVGLDANPLTVPGGRVLSQQQGVQGTLDPLYDRAGWPGLAEALSLAAGATVATC